MLITTIMRISDIKLAAVFYILHNINSICLRKGLIIKISGYQKEVGAVE